MYSTKAAMVHRRLGNNILSGYRHDYPSILADQ